MQKTLLRFVFTWIIMWCLFGMASYASAQKEDPSQIYPREQKIDFKRGTEVSGDPLGPDGVITIEKRDRRLQGLIRYRESFREKVLSSAKSL